MVCGIVAVLPALQNDAARLITSAHNTIKKERMKFRSFGRRYNPILNQGFCRTIFPISKKRLGGELDILPDPFIRNGEYFHAI
jgi:hypothetical protein